jgi:hypothetical protein
MAASKKINVTSPPLLTAAVSAGADITVSHFRVRATSNGTVKTPFKTLATARTLAAGGKMEVADEALTVTMNGPVTDALAMTYLDATFVTGDVIEWSTDGTNATARLAATAIPAWDNAVTV